MLRFTRLTALLLGFFMVSTPLFAAYTYTLTWGKPNTHTYFVALETQVQTATFTDFKIPAWRPGRYILQDYAGAVSHFSAADAQNVALKCYKTDKDTWRVEHSDKTKTLTIKYRFYADNTDAGSSFLGEGQAYFNGINLFMYVPDRMNEPVTLRVPDLPLQWEVATALTKTDSRNVFTAKTYHELVDCPTVFSDSIKHLSFKIDSTTFYIHFQGGYLGDAATDKAAIDGIKSICREQAAIFGGFSFKEYHFIYRLLPFEFRHAVEHATCASFTMPQRTTQSAIALRGLLGITAHEFWHAWNVKRIRPAAMMPYDYSRQQYTRCQWFTEGVTDYYTHLTLLRAGLMTQENFCNQMASIVYNADNPYASSVVSPSLSSFDSWLAPSPYAHPFHQISYYTLGAKMGLVFDAALRKESGNKVSLDDVFRYLQDTYAVKGIGYPEDGIRLAAEALTGKSWQVFFDKYVDGTEKVNYPELLPALGLQATMGQDRNNLTRCFGILRNEYSPQGITITAIHPESDAFAGGLGEGDLILMVDGESAVDMDLERVLSKKEQNGTLTLKVFSDCRTKTLKIFFGTRYAPTTIEITPARDKKLEAIFEQWTESNIGKRK